MEIFPITTSLLLQWYTEYNKKYFNNELPAATLQNFCIRNYKPFGKFHHPKLVRGKQRPWMISVTDRYIIDEHNRRHTLLHEMCHLYCFVNGYPREGHGRHWKAIAAHVSTQSGFDIQRLHPGTFEMSNEAAKDTAVKAYPFVVYTHRIGGKECVLIVKTTAGVLSRSISWRSNSYHINAYGKPIGLFLSNAFPKWPLRKNIRRGFVFTRVDYEKDILPVFSKGKNFKTPIELLRAATLE